MEREEYIKQLGYYGDLRLLGNDEFITVKMNLLAEFDGLKAENEKLSTKVAELDGREFDADEVDQCNDCGEWIKPPPCPECQGTKYINRVVSVTDWEWHRYYMIVDCLNCSGAKG